MKTATLTRELLHGLKAVLGTGGWLEEPADRAPFEVDFRQRFRGRTPLVALPDSTQAVAALLAYCHEHRIAVVPHGGNTSYCGAATPDASGNQIVVSLRRMQRLREVDAANASLTAEAGCVLAQLQAAARDAGRQLSMSLGSEGSCMLGGILSTNAGGTAVLRYGMMRELVLGLEVVLPDGRVLNQLGKLRKDNTGYDLKQLFIGAEGTLGIITAACLRLHPEPRAQATAFLALPSPEAAVQLLARLRAALGDAVTTFELIPRRALEFACHHLPGAREPLPESSPWYVLTEASMPAADSGLDARMQAALANAIEAGLVSDAALAGSLAQRESFWRLREGIPEAQSREGASLKHDISVSTSRLPEFIMEATALMEGLVHGIRVVAYGHLGDGNLHFNASAPEQGDPEDFLAQGPRLRRAMHDLVASYGGSFSAEHGIGQAKLEELERYEDPVALELMRSIKRTLDPRGIMNPGKVFAPLPSD